jgi:SP family facilitated glucose transporter-like MFS transporter 1
MITVNLVLKKLRGEDDVQNINDEMNEMALEQKNQGVEVSYKDLFTKKQYYRPLICAVMLQLSQQLSGINAVIFYSTSIFKSVGLKEEMAVYATIMLSVVQIVMTFASMALIEKAGRRILLLVGLGGMCVFSVGLAVSRILSVHHDGFKYLSIVSMVAYIIFFSIAPGK